MLCYMQYNLYEYIYKRQTPQTVKHDTMSEALVTTKTKLTL